MQPTIIFDFDGTLADSFNLVVDIFYELTDQPRIDDPELIAFLRKQPVMVVVKEFGIKPTHLPRLVVKGRKMMGERMDVVQLFDGMHEALEVLHNQGFQLYVMSSNSAANIEHFLRANHLTKYFTRVYGGIGLFSKAAAIKKVLRQNHLSPSECIYVGDEARDIEGAQKAGLRMISVGWGYNDAVLLRSRKPDALIMHPQQLVSAIQGL